MATKPNEVQIQPGEPRKQAGNPPPSNDLLILQWNCRGIIEELPEINARLRMRPVHVLALCEGALPGTRTVGGYVKYVSPTIPTFPNGSAALYIKRDIQQHRIDTSGLCCEQVECVAVKLQIGGRVLTVANIYARAGHSSNRADALLGLRALVHGGDLIVCGDFNCHNTLWGSTHTSRGGRRLGEAIKDADLALANDGSPTYLRGATYSSVLDLTLHSPHLPILWSPAPDPEGSDHLPILVTLKDGAKATSRQVQVTDWNAFRAAMRRSAECTHEGIRQSMNRATKLVRVPANKPDPDLKMCGLIAARRRAHRRFRTTRSAEDERALKTATGRLRGYTKRADKRRWRRYCESLDPRKAPAQFGGRSTPCPTRDVHTQPAVPFTGPGHNGRAIRGYICPRGHDRGARECRATTSPNSQKGEKIPRPFPRHSSLPRRGERRARWPRKGGGNAKRRGSARRRFHEERARRCDRCPEAEKCPRPRRSHQPSSEKSSTGIPTSPP